MRHVIQHNEKVNTFKNNICKFDEILKKKLHIDIDCSERVFTSLSKHFWQQLHHWVFWVWRNKLCTPGIRGFLSFFFPDLCHVGWRALVVCRWWVMPCFLQTQYWESRPNSSILASSDQIILFLTVWVSFRYFHEMSKQAFMCLFEERPASGHSAVKPKSVECCSDGCPSGSHSQLHRESLELSQSDHLVLGHLSY